MNGDKPVIQQFLEFGFSQIILHFSSPVYWKAEGLDLGFDLPVYQGLRSFLPISGGCRLISALDPASSLITLSIYLTVGLFVKDYIRLAFSDILAGKGNTSDATP